MPLTFAELHTFAKFGLDDKPAMLLGMDVLSLCTKVSVDFKRREATFTLPKNAERDDGYVSPLRDSASRILQR
jgi:hypothetical protein